MNEHERPKSGRASGSRASVLELSRWREGATAGLMVSVWGRRSRGARVLQRTECPGLIETIRRPAQSRGSIEGANGSVRRRARRGELLAGCLATVQPQVLEDAADDLGVFDAGDDLDRAATVFAALDLDAEDALRRCAQLIAACFGTALPCPSSDPPRPRLPGTICARKR
jgi:hypothetical protein